MNRWLQMLLKCTFPIWTWIYIYIQRYGRRKGTTERLTEEMNTPMKIHNFEFCFLFTRSSMTTTSKTLLAEPVIHICFKSIQSKAVEIIAKQPQQQSHIENQKGTKHISFAFTNKQFINLYLNFTSGVDFESAIWFSSERISSTSLYQRFNSRCWSFVSVSLLL